MQRKAEAKTQTLDRARRIYPVLDVITSTFQKELSLKETGYIIDERRKTNPEQAGSPLGLSLVSRSHELDRIFPLETVEIKSFGQKHDYDINEVMIHTGSYADELARSMNALAVTVATDIYFRSDKYNPASEEGRALLAHELTHVSQHSEKRITPNTTNAELEGEAEQAELQEVYDTDPYISLNGARQIYKIRKSQMPRLVAMTADYVDNWVRQQNYSLSEEKYLHLLCTYQEMLKEGKIW